MNVPQCREPRAPAFVLLIAFAAKPAPVPSSLGVKDVISNMDGDGDQLLHECADEDSKHILNSIMYDGTFDTIRQKVWLAYPTYGARHVQM